MGKVRDNISLVLSLLLHYNFVFFLSVVVYYLVKSGTRDGGEPRLVKLVETYPSVVHIDLKLLKPNTILYASHHVGYLLHMFHPVQAIALLPNSTHSKYISYLGMKKSPLFLLTKNLVL